MFGIWRSASDRALAFGIAILFQSQLGAQLDDGSSYDMIGILFSSFHRRTCNLPFATLKCNSDTGHPK